MDHIIVPLDTSDLSARALDAAKRLAAAFGSRLTLVTVLDTAVRNELRAAAESESIRIEDAAETYLGSVASQLRDDGFDVTTRVVDATDSAAAITDAASSNGADLIVMCTHGRSGAGRWLLGSVADRVIRSSTVPVHVIPVRR